MSVKKTPESLNEYQALYDQFGSKIAVAHHLGINIRTLQRWLEQYKEQQSPDTDDHLELLPHLKTSHNLNDLCELVDRSAKTVREWLEQLQAAGYNVVCHEGIYSISTYISPSEETFDHATKSLHLKIGIVSDSHLCSISQQKTHLNTTYDIFENEGITSVYHCGDLLAGVGVYPGQDDEIFRHTQEDQTDYAIEHYPQRKGIKTYTISGNHDLVFLKRRGGDPIKRLSLERKDIIYLGRYSATVQLAKNCSMYLLHPDGGKAYALSYKPQKLVESFEGGAKPNIACMGHYHSYDLCCPRNVWSIMVPCFETSTLFTRRKFIEPVVAGLILELDFTEDGAIQRLRQECIKYLVPIEHDY